MSVFKIQFIIHKVETEACEGKLQFLILGHVFFYELKCCELIGLSFEIVSLVVVESYMYFWIVG